MLIIFTIFFSLLKIIFLYRILDEYEMYTEQNPFKLNDYVMLTYFLNNILYKLINDNLLGKLFYLVTLF